MARRKRKAPAFQLYVADFINGTITMNNEEVGVYIRYLCYEWDKGGLPDNETLLARIAMIQEVEPIGSFREKFKNVLEKFS